MNFWTHVAFQMFIHLSFVASKQKKKDWVKKKTRACWLMLRCIYSSHLTSLKLNKKEREWIRSKKRASKKLAKTEKKQKREEGSQTYQKKKNIQERLTHIIIESSRMNSWLMLCFKYSSLVCCVKKQTEMKPEKKTWEIDDSCYVSNISFDASRTDRNKMKKQKQKRLMIHFTFQMFILLSFAASRNKQKKTEKNERKKRSLTHIAFQMLIHLSSLLLPQETDRKSAKAKNKKIKTKARARERERVCVCDEE